MGPNEDPIAVSNVWKNMPERVAPLYRLKIIDTHGHAYFLIGVKADLVPALDWFENLAPEPTIRMSGFDDEADRRPITIVVKHENVTGMLLSRV